MLPSHFNLSQFMEDQYAQQAQFMPMYYITSGNSEGFWNPINFNQNTIHYIAPAPVVLNFPLVQKSERPTATRQRIVKHDENREIQSSSGCQLQNQDSALKEDLKFIQKYGRNISSNIFHQMLKIIKSDKQIYNFLKIIIENSNVQLTPKEFLSILGKRMNKLKAYVTLKKMKSIFRPRKPQPPSAEGKRRQTEFLKVLRVMCRHYLSNVHIHYVYNKLKIKKDSRMGHMKGVRKILNLLK